MKADSNTGTQSGGVSRVEIVHRVEGNGQLSEHQLQSLMRSSGFENAVSNIVMRALQRSRTLSGGWSMEQTTQPLPTTQEDRVAALENELAAMA